MPDGSVKALPSMAAFSLAHAKVSAWLAGLGGEITVLAAGNLAQYPNRAFTAGW